MAGILLADADQGDAVGAGFRRQVEVHHLREGPAHDRHEDLVQRRGQYRGFVLGRAAHVAAVVDGVAAQAQALDGEHREFALAVVVAGVVAEGTLDGGVAGADEALHQDLGPGRRVQAGQGAAPDAAAGAAQQTGELELRERVRYRRHRRQQCRRIGAQRHQHREGTVGMRGTPVGVVQGAAAMRQPAHDHPVAAEQLLAIDGDVLPRLPGAAGDDQAEGDQAGDIAGPAALDRQPAEIDRVAFQHVLVEGGLVHVPGRDVRQLRQFRPAGERLAQVARPAWFLQRRQQLAQFAQRGQRPVAQGQLDAAAVPEQVAQQRMRGADRLFHQQGRAAPFQGQAAQGGAFQLRIHRLRHAQQLAVALQGVEETAQVVAGHGGQAARRSARRR